MFLSKLSSVGRIVSLCPRVIVCTAVLALAVAFVLPAAGRAESVVSTQDGFRAFFNSFCGEWVGACVQSTDGEAAENKYFHVVVKRLGEDKFESRFKYYRMDEAGGPLPVGETIIISMIGPDGAVTNTVKGQGEVLVEDKPKNQEYELVEAITCTGPDSLEGEGTGKIKISGMPLGLGKHGKIRDAQTTWSMKDGVVKVHQSLKVRFRALVFTKSFHIVCDYTGRRGSDVASLMRNDRQLTAKKTNGTGRS